MPQTVQKPVGAGEGQSGGKVKVKNKGAPRKAPAARGRGRPQWWRRIDDTDPITLEPLNKLGVPPFGLQSEDGAHTHLFDGRVLAMYLVSSGQFLNPLTNVPLDRADCERLDGHLKENRLGQPCVATVFDEVERKGEESRQVRSLREEASLIMAAIFSQGVSHAMPSQRELREVRRSAGRPSARQPPPETRQVGIEGLVLYDDDWGMVPEPPPRPEEAFPALSSVGDAGTPAHSWSSPGVSVPHSFRGPPPGGAPDTTAEPGPGLGPSERPVQAGAVPQPQWGQIAANLNANTSEWTMRPSAGARGRSRQGPGTAPRRQLTEEEEARLQRRRQLAEAFGVSDPERPSEFLVQSAAQSYSAESLAFARKFLGRTRAIEAALDNFIASGRARMTLLSASKIERKVTHELSQLYGIVTCSFGSGSGRQVDLFRPSSYIPGAAGCASSSSAGANAPSTPLCRPPVLLSEAAVLPDETLKAAAGSEAEEGHPEELLLCDVEVPEGNLAGFFHGLDVVRVEARPSGAGPSMTYALKFLTKDDFVRACDRAAGGVKGAFRVQGATGHPGPQVGSAAPPMPEASSRAVAPRVARDAQVPAAPRGLPAARHTENPFAAEPPVDPDALETLLGMGFGRNRCVRALHGPAADAGLEGAVAWLLAREGDVGLDEPLLVPRRAFEGPRSRPRAPLPGGAVTVGNSWETLAGDE